MPIMIKFHKPLAFLKKDLVIEASYRVAFLLRMCEIFFSVAVFYFLAKLLGTSVSPYVRPYGGDYFSFVLIGIAFSGFLSIGLQSFSLNIRTEQLMGTLEAMLVTPTKLSVIVLAAALWKLWYELLPEIMSLVFFSAILLPLSLLLFQYGVNKAKNQGSLIQY